MSSSDRPLIYAHRGASADHAENTLPAFLGALEQGSDWVELDVHLAGDGGLVIHHDPHYSDGRSVQEHPAGARPSTVPLLDEALEACSGMGVNIEIKVTRPGTDLADRVVELVGSRRARGVDQPICISSFDEGTLDRVRSLDPGIDTAQLLFDLSADPEAVQRAADGGAVAINPWDPFVDDALVQRCRSLGLAVNAWTVDDRDRIIELAALGVDGIITNTPALARSYLG
jgi:glycerophosphoryl diester phosphodiesterase